MKERCRGWVPIGRRSARQPGPFSTPILNRDARGARGTSHETDHRVHHRVDVLDGRHGTIGGHDAQHDLRTGRGLVAAKGAVVLRTGPNTYDRYVRDASFCAVQESVRPDWVRTADSAQCYVGGVCRMREID